MIERMTAEVIAMSKLSSHRMATSEAAATDHIDRSRIVSERKIDSRSAPHSGDDAGREDGAAQVDAIVITEADTEARIPGLAPAQRDPANRIHDADDFDTADKGNQRGCVNRGPRDRSRRPSPQSADRYPAAIMEWRITPRRIVNPGPSPRRHEAPVAKAVRSPIGHHAVGEPDVAVNRSRSPGTRDIEIGCAHYARRNGSNRDRIFRSGIAFSAPGIELVGIRHAVLVVAGGIALDHDLFVVIQRSRLAV